MAIAEAINDGTRWIPGTLDDPSAVLSFNAGVDECARNIADVMQADNPRFDRARFLKACGAQ